MNPPDKRRRPARIERALAAACMALLCIITFVNVVTRYLTNASFAFTEEVSVFLLVLLTLLGSVAAFIDGGHIRITLFADLLPKSGKKLCSALEWLANVALFGLLTVLGYRMAFDDFEHMVLGLGPRNHRQVSAGFQPERTNRFGGGGRHRVCAVGNHRDLLTGDP